MRIQQTSHRGCMVLTLAGRLDQAAAPQVRRAILKQLAEHSPAIICDLSQVEALDPTGCGDVFGAAAFARLLAGDTVETALRHATVMAGRNAVLRGAGGLGRHLRGELLVP